jgi:hypothetical protein
MKTGQTTAGVWKRRWTTKKEWERYKKAINDVVAIVEAQRRNKQNKNK